jgi:succinoglycan biosynthesis transport protein ExoP
MSDRYPVSEGPVQDAGKTAAPGFSARPLRPSLALDPAPDEVHVLDAVKVLYRRRWVIATVFTITVLTAIVHAFVATPIFEAETRLLIESGDPNVVSFQAVIDEGQPTADYYQTQYGILRSRGLARRTIDSLNLWDSTQLSARPGVVRRTLDGLNPWRSPQPGAEVREATPEAVQGTRGQETRQQSRAIDAFLANLIIAPVRNSRLVDVKFRSPDPNIAARLVNAFATNYIEQTLEYKFTASHEATSWLAERLAEQRTQVEAAETALQQYRERNGAISLEDRENIVVQKLADLSAAVTRVHAERTQKEALDRQLRATGGDQAQLDTFPAILSNSFIQRQKAELADLQQRRAQLADNLGPLHPQMLELAAAIRNSELKLRAEIDKVVLSVRTEYQAVLSQEQSLISALELQKAEALAMNRLAIDYGVLVRDVESAKQIYETLMQRGKETGVAGELRTSNIRIVDVAQQPRSPYTPRLRMNVLLGIFGGLILALAFGFLFEYLDGSIKSPEEVKACLGVPALGMLPELGKRSMGSHLLSAGVRPDFSEAIRAIRMNVLFSMSQDGACTLAVTSTGPNEGKTTVASNLAIAFALGGHRVLLMDADMRRPSVHELFDMNQEPGLSNVLVGNAKPDEAMRKTDVAGLWMLPSGRVPPNPAELLGSPRFEELLRSLGDQFDTIIMDTPPVMAVSDPSVIASMASGVLFVVGADMTGRRPARTALEQLEKGRARILGAILNRVQLEKHSYYYSRYFRREYTTYYSPAAS